MMSSSTLPATFPFWFFHQISHFGGFCVGFLGSIFGWRVDNQIIILLFFPRLAYFSDLLCFSFQQSQAGGEAARGAMGWPASVDERPQF